jgi:hypothetical protein
MTNQCDKLKASGPESLRAPNLILSLMTAFVDFDFCDPKWCSKICDLISCAQDYRWRGGGGEGVGARVVARGNTSAGDGMQHGNDHIAFEVQ